MLSFYSHALEQKLLASWIHYPQDLELARDQLSSEAFHNPHHKTIYNALIHQLDQAIPIDIATLKAYLTTHNLLEKAGGEIYLINMPAVNMGRSADIQKEIILLTHLLLLRELKNTLSLFHSHLNQEITDALGLLDYFQQKLFALAEQYIPTDYLPLAGAIQRVEQEIKIAQEEGHIPSISTGFTSVDEIIGGWQANDLIILAARPGMGKTAFALSFIQKH